MRQLAFMLVRPQSRGRQRVGRRFSGGRVRRQRHQGRGVFLRTSRRGLNGPEDLPETLTFELVDSPCAPGAGELADVPEVRDLETGSTWNIEAGIATAGPLRGTVLQRAPYVSTFYWTWEDFNPNTVLLGDRFDELN